MIVRSGGCEFYLQRPSGYAQDKDMNFLQHHRERYPDATLQTYPVECADGITRMISMDTWYWQKLDFLLEVDTIDLRSITGFCLDFGKKLVGKNSEDYEHTFFTLFMHYIYTEYHRFKQRGNNIANEYWKIGFDED